MAFNKPNGYKYSSGKKPNRKIGVVYSDLSRKYVVNVKGINGKARALKQFDKESDAKDFYEKHKNDEAKIGNGFYSS